MLQDLCQANHCSLKKPVSALVAAMKSLSDQWIYIIPRPAPSPPTRQLMYQSLRETKSQQRRKAKQDNAELAQFGRDT